jgi:hypothetical protein
MICWPPGSRLFEDHAKSGKSSRVRFSLVTMAGGERETRKGPALIHRAKYKGVTYRLGQDERRIGRRHRRPTDHTIQASEDSSNGDGGAGRRRRTGMARERAVRSRGRPITGPAGARSATPRLVVDSMSVGNVSEFMAIGDPNPLDFEGIGYLPGAASSYAYGVSADGSTVVGGSGADAFRWTASTGLVDLGAGSA